MYEECMIVPCYNGANKYPALQIKGGGLGF